MEQDLLQTIQALKDDVEVTLDDLEFIKIKIDNGELENLFEIVEILNNKIEEFRLQKGDKGDKGKSGKDGKNGKDGLDGKDGIDGIDGRDGLDGKDGTEITSDQIRDKLQSLDGENRLDASAIKNLPTFIDKIAKDGYPKGLPQPAASLTYQLNGAQIGRGNIFNIEGSNITTKTNGDRTTYALNFQSPLGYTPENVANKSTSTSLGTSDTLYPSQNAVKTYVDTAVSGVGGLTQPQVMARTLGC